MYANRPNKIHHASKLLTAVVLTTVASLSFVLRLGAQGIATTESVLHSFSDGRLANDGRIPDAPLILGSDGNLYGTTLDGGTNVTPPGSSIAGSGTVFRMTASGAMTILHVFDDGTVANDGEYPSAGLVQATDGNFYGTTRGGGVYGGGTVYKMTPTGTVTIVYSFGKTFLGGNTPTGGLVQGSDGELYGTTQLGGVTDWQFSDNYGCGIVFKITLTGSITVLHVFCDGTIKNDAALPNSSLIQATDGNFYGTTEGGGTLGSGTVFKMTSEGAITILHSFDNTVASNDGIDPTSPLVQGSDGNFYGVTAEGGSTSTPHTSDWGDGTVFKITPTGDVTILHSFNDGSVVKDGMDPTQLILGFDGNFYGVSALGGSSTKSYLNGPGVGTLFRVTSAGEVTILYSFDVDGGDGAEPASLIQTSDGMFYGVTLYGGSTQQSSLYPNPGYGSAFIASAFGAGPTGLNATAGNEKISLSWTALPDAVSYNVYRGTTSNHESPIPVQTGIKSTAYINTGLADGTAYFYRVTALLADGMTAPSGEASATPEPPPSAPTDLTTKEGNEEAMLSWSPSVVATGYDVFRGTSPHDERSVPIATVDGTSYASTGLTNGITYYYVVKAVNGAGTSKASNEASVAPVLAIPVSPTDLSATAGSEQIVLSWMGSISATSYNVYRGSALNTISTTPIATGIVTIGFTNTGLTDGKTYYYVVKAVNAMGTSKASNPASAMP